ncbi:MAG TPA: TolC family protein [Bacteroidia bacterium]|jgi:outer membrane protein TolC|nr:TolC family protein [Bacteroidia bacterium]
MKKKVPSLYWPTALMLLFCNISFAQDQLNIDSCYVMAKSNYPLIKQQELISKTKDYTLDNATKGYLPQIGINGQASYQSDVTQIPISLPGMNVPTLSKDQYKIYGEITQPLTDVLVINQQKKLINDNSTVEQEKLEVELYKLKERVNQLYFGVLLINAQLQQTELLKKDIQRSIDKTNAALANGTALKSSVNILKAELLKAEQRTIELKTNRKGYVEMLSVFINKKINEQTAFQKPAAKGNTLTINRPELKLFDAQKSTFTAQNKLITARNIPRLSLFFQSGYGKPALNMLNPDFDFHYIGGLRLSWNLSAFYTFKKDKKIIVLNQDLVEVQRQVFLFNTQLSLTQQQTELNKLEELIKSDEEILALRTSIKTTANSQLENGAITMNDYVSYVNAEDQAKQNKLTHQIQLLMTQYAAQTIAGN